MRFAGKVVWITGASSGIGEALAHAFHGEGAHVILSARREGELARVAADCHGRGGGETMALPLDLARPDSLADAAGHALDRFGHIDVLVNNAGLAHRGLVADTEMPVYRELFETNVFGPLALTKLVLPSMMARASGRIVVISSVAGRYSSPMRSGYNAAKRALHGLYDSLRAELWPHGVGVTLIVLGAARTRITVNARRGDGRAYGKMDPFIADGMAPPDAARRILAATARGKDEAMIARPSHRWLVYRKHFLPRLAARAVRLRRVPET